MAVSPGRVIPRPPSGGVCRPIRIIPLIIRCAAAMLACVCLRVPAAWGDADNAIPAGEVVIAAVAAPDVGADAALGELPGLAWTDTLVVSATPLVSIPLPTTAAVVTRVDLQGEPAGRDVAEVLAATAGLQVRRLGADGASAIPSLRGGAAAQVRLFLDGMPLPDAAEGGGSLDLVPAERLAAVEIHRGVVPAALGGAGGIGAINLLTNAAPAHPFAAAGVGSFGARSLRAGTGWRSESGLAWADLAVYARRADNDFTFRDHRQTFHNTSDDTLAVRGNAWVREHGAWLAATKLSGRLVLRAGAGWLRRDGGRPGPLGYLTPHASVRHERADVRLRAELDDGKLAADIAAGRSDDRLDDQLGEVALGRRGVGRALAHDLGGRLVWSPRRGRAVAPSLGASWRRQWERDSFNDVAEPQRRRTQVGGFATVDLACGRWRATPAWRWQRTRDDFPPVPAFPWLPTPPAVVNTRDDRAPSLGLVCEAVPGRLFLEAHAARARREPTWAELFGVRGSLDGNRALKPEAITSYDIAIVCRPGDAGFEARLAVFDAATDDKIIFLQNSQRTSKAVNIGATRTRGLECELAVHDGGANRLSGNLTWQDARDRSGLPAWDGKRLPFLPPFEARLYGATAVAGWEPWLEWTCQSGNPRDRADTDLDRAPARARMGAGLSRRMSAPWLGEAATVRVSAAVENLTDNDVYDVEGFPLPGRTWRLSVALADL